MNLLPAESKESLHRMYRNGVLTSWLWALTGVLLVSLAFLLPTWMYLWITGPTPGEVSALPIQAKVLADATRARELLSFLKTDQKNPTQPTDLIDLALAAVPKGVTLSGLRYEEGKLFLTGVAADRAALNFFVKSLKANPHFATAEFPVTELAPRANVPFSLVIPVRAP